MSLSENIQSSLSSDSTNKLIENESDPVNNDKIVLLEDSKSFNMTQGEIYGAKTSVPTSSANNSRSNGGQNLDENDYIKIDEITLPILLGIIEASEITESVPGTEVSNKTESTLIEIEKCLLSQCSPITIERKRLLLEMTINARRNILLTFAKLQDLYSKLLQLKSKLILVKLKTSQTSFNAANQHRKFANLLEQIIQEILSVFFQHKEVFKKCKSVLEVFLQNIEERLVNKNVPSAILQAHNCYFSILEDSRKIHLESFIKVSEELENFMQNSWKISSEDANGRIELYLAAIYKAEYIYTELMSFSNMIQHLYAYMEFSLE